MSMRVMNTDRDGDSNNMFSSHDIILIWRVRYRKVLKLIVACKAFSTMALSRILCQAEPLNKQGKSEGFESCDQPIIWKRPIWVTIGNVLSRVTLKFDG